jgi:SLAP domain-containing protein
MKKMLVLIILVLAAGCGTSTPSSLPAEEGLASDNSLNDKMVHRLEQRGYGTESGNQNYEEEMEEAEEDAPSAAEVLLETGNWTQVFLNLSEEDYEIYTEEQLQYFYEDTQERFPPPVTGKVDALASVIYEQEEGILLLGVIRNGTEEELSRNRLESSTLRINDSNQSRLGTLDFLAELTVEEVDSGEAVPFRFFIPYEELRHPEFPFGEFQYFLNFELGEEEEEMNEEEDDEDPDEVSVDEENEEQEEE